MGVSSAFRSYSVSVAEALSGCYRSLLRRRHVVTSSLTMGTARRETPRDADELDGLPPLDGDGSDGPESPIAEGDDLATTLEHEEEAGRGGLDDSTPASDGQ